jgi:hypothetical protein
MFSFGKKWICSHCGYVGKPVSQMKGSFLMEIALWLFFLFPGLLYSIWRLTSVEKVCPQCKSPNMIPVDSPRGKKIWEELN